MNEAYFQRIFEQSQYVNLTMLNIAAKIKMEDGDLGFYSHFLFFISPLIFIHISGLFEVEEIKHFSCGQTKPKHS